MVTPSAQTSSDYVVYKVSLFYFSSSNTYPKTNSGLL